MLFTFYIQEVSNKIFNYLQLFKCKICVLHFLDNNLMGIIDVISSLLKGSAEQSATSEDSFKNCSNKGNNIFESMFKGS